MERTFDKRYKGEHPMFDSSDTCDWCKEPCTVLNEWHKLLICDRCLERKRESEEDNARRYAYSDRAVNDLNRRKSR